MWDTSRFNSEPAMDTWSWNQIPNGKRDDAPRPDRRVRHGYRLFRNCMEYLGSASMAFVATVLILHLWSVL